MKEFDFWGRKQWAEAGLCEWIVCQRICDYGVGADGSTKGKNKIIIIDTWSFYFFTFCELLEGLWNIIG